MLHLACTEACSWLVEQPPLPCLLPFLRLLLKRTQFLAGAGNNTTFLVLLLGGGMGKFEGTHQPFSCEEPVVGCCELQDVLA